MPGQFKSTSTAAATISTPPPPPPASGSNAVPVLSVVDSVVVDISDSSSVTVASGPEQDASRSTASIAPAMEDQNSTQVELFRDFLSFMERQCARPPVMSSAVSSAPVQFSRRLIYTAAPSGLPYSAVIPPVPSSLPAPVSGSRGVQGQ